VISSPTKKKLTPVTEKSSPPDNKFAIQLSKPAFLVEVARNCIYITIYAIKFMIIQENHKILTRINDYPYNVLIATNLAEVTLY
jgi:hypothetical protein